MRPHARQVGEVHEDVEPLQRQLVLAQHLFGKLLDDLPVRGEKGLPEAGLVIQRSEEHTSELQSRHYHVCRPLLEEKNAEELLVACWLDPAAIRVERFVPTGD